MPLLPARHYVSDHTRFIDELLQKKPEIDTSRRIGRKIWWDKLPSEVEAQREMNAGRVPQKGYVYYALK
ncbi:MAG TPA: DUF3460 family protein [Casimicrobiaceae bacterium]|jgi:hypothetical protein|nr:DUF3460 family protein [Casimicrobiaceae bacterium]